MIEGFCRFRELLAFAINQEFQFSEVIDKELSILPEGRLGISHDDKNFYFSNHIGNRNWGITRDKELVHQLARRKYLEQLSKEINEDLDFAKKARNFLTKPKRTRNKKATDLYSGTAALLQSYRNAGLDIMKITCTARQYRWFCAEYEKSDLYPEQLTYTTDSGVKVRSKSERAIGNALEALGIPYRYEEAKAVEVLWMERSGQAQATKYRTYYPDFTILLPNGELVIWEHLGRVDVESYRIHNAEKIAALRGTGTVKFENFIVTYESDIRDSGALSKIITSRLLMRFV